MFQKLEIFTYLPSAQASLMPWSGMADVRRYYIQIFLVFTSEYEAGRTHTCARSKAEY